MNRLALDILELGNPLTNVGAVGVELLTLQQWIEDAKVGLRIDAGRGGKSPAAVVGGKVAVDEVLHKVALAHSPVDQEVFGEEGGDDHAAAVVHPARVVELTHRSVDNGVASATIAPGGEGHFVVFPLDVGILGLEGFVHAWISQLVRRQQWNEVPTIQKASERVRACKSLARRPRKSKS